MTMIKYKAEICFEPDHTNLAHFFDCAFTVETNDSIALAQKLLSEHAGLGAIHIHNVKPLVANPTDQDLEPMDDPTEDDTLQGIIEIIVQRSGLFLELMGYDDPDATAQYELKVMGE